MSTTIEDLFDSIEEVASEAVEAQQLLYTVEDELLKLKRENKKLRELCKYMKRSLCEADPVDNPCDLCGGWDSGLNDCAYELQMRELGIEV